jgi:hypothetical protein
LLLLPIATLIGGLLIGAVVYFVSNLIYLIIFFPIIMGGLGGAVIAVFFGVLIALLLL